MALSKEALDQIKNNLKIAEKTLKELEPEIEKARMAGIDVTDQKKKATELKIAINKMKLVYGK